MPTAVRGLITGIAAFAAFFFLFWTVFALAIPENGPEWVATLVAALGAAAVGWFVWTGLRPGVPSSGFVRTVTLGAVMTGTFGFAAGFFGPLIFAPGANQGPLLGLFITGPLGFVLGAVGGAGYWLVRR